MQIEHDEVRWGRARIVVVADYGVSLVRSGTAIMHIILPGLPALTQGSNAKPSPNHQYACQSDIGRPAGKGKPPRRANRQGRRLMERALLPGLVMNMHTDPARCLRVCPVWLIAILAYHTSD